MQTTHYRNSEPDWPGVKRHVLQRLEEGLDPHLFYHGVHHTRDDVLPAAKRLAALAGLDQESALRLRTAALFHDTGFLKQYQNNEPIAADIAVETLPRYGYAEDQIATISALILATRMPQRPSSRLQALLCDADMDSLGRDDYLETSLNLRMELIAHGQTISLEAWYRRQVDFLSGHTYFTNAAQSLRRAKKQENLAMVRGLLNDLVREQALAPDEAA
jgi:uncharacterized protein